LAVGLIGGLYRHPGDLLGRRFEAHAKEGLNNIVHRKGAKDAKISFCFYIHAFFFARFASLR
jgi:hypothetical protein